MTAFLDALVVLVRDAGPVPDVGVIRYCDNGLSVVGLPEEVYRMRCASCVLLSVYVAAVGYQNGKRMDLCCSAMGSDIEHAWVREDGVLRDPSVEGGAYIPPEVYIGGVIVPVDIRRRQE